MYLLPGLEAQQVEKHWFTVLRPEHCKCSAEYDLNFLIINKTLLLSQKFMKRFPHQNCTFIRYKNDALEVRVLGSFIEFPLLEISRFKAENKLVKVC